MTSTTTTSPKPESDADRAASVVAGRTIAPKPKRASRATKSAEKNATPKPTAKPKPVKPAPAPKPEPITDRAARNVVLSALNAAAGDLVESWTHPEISKNHARQILSDRLRYGGAGPEWDDRLDPFAKS